MHHVLGICTDVMGIRTYVCTDVTGMCTDVTPWGYLLTDLMVICACLEVHDLALPFPVYINGHTWLAHSCRGTGCRANLSQVLNIYSTSANAAVAQICIRT